MRLGARAHQKLLVVGGAPRAERLPQPRLFTPLEVRLLLEALQLEPEARRLRAAVESSRAELDELAGRERAASAERERKRDGRSTRPAGTAKSFRAALARGTAARCGSGVRWKARRG